MPLSAIVTIVLRVFAVLWGVEAISIFVGEAVQHSMTFRASKTFVEYLSPLFFGLAAVCMWRYAGRLAVKVTPEPDREVALGGITLKDLYCLAFVFLGLRFMLTSAGTVAAWGFYEVSLAAASDSTVPQIQTAFGEIGRAFVNVVLGGLCLVFARRLSEKLLAFHDTQVPVPPPPVDY